MHAVAARTYACHDNGAATLVVLLLAIMSIAWLWNSWIHRRHCDVRVDELMNSECLWRHVEGSASAA